jgi:LysR family transcriptional regulator for bpeEF and oprC
MDRVDAMRVFVKVVDTLSFTKTGRSLNLGTPTVSRLVHDLEELANVRLLNRSTRNVSPTAEGLAYYDACLRVLAQLDNMNEEAANAGRIPEGRIKVALSAPLAKYVLIPALRSFLDAYPKLDVEIISDDEINLVQEAVDCTIRVGAVKETSVVAREVGRVTKIMCAAPAYLARHGEPKSVAELRAHAIVGSVWNDGFGTKPWQVDVDREHVSVNMRSRVTVHDADSSISCGIEGLGIVSGYAFVLRPYIERGALREITIANRPEAKPVSMIYHPNLQMPNKLRVFIDWFREVLVEALMDSQPGNQRDTSGYQPTPSFACETVA